MILSPAFTAVCDGCGGTKEVHGGICDYSEVFLLQPNGTIATVGHEPEEVER